MKETRRTFLKAAAVAATAAAAHRLDAAAEPSVPRSELEEMTLAQMQEDLQIGRFTSRDLVEAYLRRIEAIDQNGPMLRSIIELNPDALAIAESLDRERHQGRLRGPLHGIPVAIKDNIDTADFRRISCSRRSVGHA